MTPSVMSEDDWKDWVIELARWNGWMVTHFLPSRTADGKRWITALQGVKGFPDLVLARAGEVLFRELKTDKGQPTPDQVRWLAALGDQAAIWRPRDRDLVLATLTRKATR